MNIPAALAWLTILVALPLNVWVTWKLWRLSRANPGISVLRERAIVATAVTIIVAVFAVIFLNNDKPIPWIDTNETKLITRAVVLLMGAIPPAIWLLLYRHHDEHPDG